MFGLGGGGGMRFRMFFKDTATQFTDGLDMEMAAALELEEGNRLF